MNKESTPLNKFIEKYDHNILSESIQTMYDKSGFYNVGEWSDNPARLKNACESLVIKHLDQVQSCLNPQKILDTGCGLGSGTGIIAKLYKDAHVVGINISEKQVSFAKKTNPDIDFQVMDATKMLFPTASFDLIISVEAAFHFNTRKDFLEQAYRMLRPGGQLIFSDMLFHNTEWVGSWSVPAENLITDINIYKKACVDIGFEILQCRDIKATTLSGFCSYLRQTEKMNELAEGFENSVIAYLLTSLKKDHR